MTNPRPALLRSYIAFGIALAIAAAAIIISAVSAQQTIEEAVQKDAQVPAPVKVDTQPKKTEKPQQSVENTPSEPVSQSAPADTTQPQRISNDTPVPQPKQQGAHVPFTTKEVTPGDPESYVDTVGQCPFYEMGGPKGCVPPPDIECNADWSECHLKEQ